MHTSNNATEPAEREVDGGALAEAVRGEASAPFELLAAVHEAHLVARDAALALELGDESLDVVRGLITR